MLSVKNLEYCYRVLYYFYNCNLLIISTIIHGINRCVMLASKMLAGFVALKNEVKLNFGEKSFRTIVHLLRYGHILHKIVFERNMYVEFRRLHKL